jgi:hypothetical protein
MGVLFLVPGIISLIFVIRGRVESAFLFVYLPALLLIPNGYALRLPHLPEISAAEWALLPIGWVALTRQLRSGIPSFMDILIAAFMFSSAASEVLHERVLNDGIFSWFDSFMSIGLTYLVGRRIIEPGIRLATARQFVLMLLWLGPVALIDWRLGQNLYGVMGFRIFGVDEVQTSIQLRAGHGRVAASFNDSELAGIGFALGFTVNAWLHYLNRTRSRANLGERLAKLEKFHVPALLLVLYLLMTQSRGPLLALVAGYLVLQIMRFKNTRTATCLVAVVLAVCGYAGTVYLDRYTNVSDPTVTLDEQHGSAIYRRRMAELYQPIVDRGGMLGWGRLSSPTVPGMFSIDNEYLRVHLAYGTLGYVLFLLIGAEAIRKPLFLSWKLRGMEDKALAISLVAAMAVFWISIKTVYMGEQIPQLAFLLAGWGQSIVPASTESAVVADEAAPTRFAFKRVYS